MARGPRRTGADWLKARRSPALTNASAAFAAAFLRRRPVRACVPSRGAEWSPPLHLRSRLRPLRDAISALQRRSTRQSGNRRPTAAGWARTHGSRADGMLGETKFDLRVSRRGPFSFSARIRVCRDTRIEKGPRVGYMNLAVFYTTLLRDRSPTLSQLGLKRAAEEPQASDRTRSIASSIRSTAITSSPSIGCFGAFAFGISAIEKPSFAASFKRS
jgi:hypothetical protein